MGKCCNSVRAGLRMGIYRPTIRCLRPKNIRKNRNALRKKNGLPNFCVSLLCIGYLRSSDTKAFGLVVFVGVYMVGIQEFDHYI